MLASSKSVRLLLMDMSALAYAAAYQTHLKSKFYKQRHIGVVQGVVNSVLSFAATYPSALPVALWEGEAQWRRQLLPGYKAHRARSAHRQEAKERVREQTPVAQAILGFLGVAQLWHPDAEADDLAGVLAPALSDEGVQLRLISPDTDWWQLITMQATWKAPGIGEALTMAKFCAPDRPLAPPGGWRSPREYLEAKIICGDDTDEIPGLGGLTLPMAADLLRKLPNGLTDLLQETNAVDPGLSQWLCNSGCLQLLRRNQALMDLSRVPGLSPCSLWARAPEVRLPAAYVFAKEHGLTELADRIANRRVTLPAENVNLWEKTLAALRAYCEGATHSPLLEAAA